MHIKIVVLFLGSLSLNAMGAAKEQIDQKKEAAKTEAAISLTKKVFSIPTGQSNQIKRNPLVVMLQPVNDEDAEDELLEFFLASRPDLVFEPSVQENPNEVLEALSGVGKKN